MGRSGRGVFKRSKTWFKKNHVIAKLNPTRRMRTILHSVYTRATQEQVQLTDKKGFVSSTPSNAQPLRTVMQLRPKVSYVALVKKLQAKKEGDLQPQGRRHPLKSPDNQLEEGKEAGSQSGVVSSAIDMLAQAALDHQQTNRDHDGKRVLEADAPKGLPAQEKICCPHCGFCTLTRNFYVKVPQASTFGSSPAAKALPEIDTKKKYQTRQATGRSNKNRRALLRAQRLRNRCGTTWPVYKCGGIDPKLRDDSKCISTNDSPTDCDDHRYCKRFSNELTPMMNILGVFEFGPVSMKLFIASIVLFFIYDWWSHQYFQRRGIPVAKYLPVLGSLMAVRTGLGYRMKEYHKKYGRVFGWYTFRMPVLGITDVNLLKQIMGTNFSHFTNRQDIVLRRKPLDNGLSALKDDHWKNIRSVVTPAFSVLKMKRMSPVINECCDLLLENIRKAETEGRPVDCRVSYGGFTMDSIARCGFGLKVDSQKNKDDEFVVMAQKAFNPRDLRGLLLLFNFIPSLKPVLRYFDVGYMAPEVTQFFMRVIDQARKLRKDHKEDSSEPIDMLQLLLNAHNETADADADEAGPQLRNKAPKRALKTEEVMGLSTSFFLAGYETTMALLSFASYLLATNQDCQEKLYSEIMDMAPTRDLVGYDMVSKMTYLDMVICETLRYYPPAAGVFRICNKAFSHSGISIDKGCLVFISIYTVHHDEECWPDPEKFDPERFSPEKKASLQPCTYLPFGFGPRSCIGMRFALLEAKMALVRVLQQYRLDVCPETQIPLKMARGGFLFPKRGIKLSPVSRK